MEKVEEKKLLCATTSVRVKGNLLRERETYTPILESDGVPARLQGDREG
jgi:hypothetical protein